MVLYLAELVYDILTGANLWIKVVVRVEFQHNTYLQALARDVLKAQEG